MTDDTMNTLTVPGSFMRAFALLAEARFPDPALRGAHQWTWESEALQVLALHLRGDEQTHAIDAMVSTADARQAELAQVANEGVAALAEVRENAYGKPAELREEVA